MCGQCLLRTFYQSPRIVLNLAASCNQYISHSYLALVIHHVDYAADAAVSWQIFGSQVAPAWARVLLYRCQAADLALWKYGVTYRGLACERHEISPTHALDY